jgi:hypothetical protein
MPLSPTDFQTDVVRQYFTESCKMFTAYATFTDGFPNRHSLSVFYRELQNIYCICHKHRWNNSVGIFPTVKLLNVVVTSYSETNFYGMIQLLLFSALEMVLLEFLV